MDGVLDPQAIELASAGDRALHAAVEGNVLYVATDDAGEGGDVFIYLADSPGALTDANWAKSGQVAEWDAFLADENDNDYEGWFDVSSSVEAITGANGGVLEGTINLLEEFGELPEEIYLAVAVFESGDGGELLYTLQLPASLDADGNLDASEFVAFALTARLACRFQRRWLCRCPRPSHLAVRCWPIRRRRRRRRRRHRRPRLHCLAATTHGSSAPVASQATAVPEARSLIFACLAASLVAAARL